MRSSLFLLVVGLAGMLGGAWLIGRWAVGVVVLLFGLGLIATAMLRNEEERKQQPQVAAFAPAHSEAESIDRIFDRQRATP